jgi:predicted membrane protein
VIIATTAMFWISHFFNVFNNQFISITLACIRPFLIFYPLYKSNKYKGRSDFPLQCVLKNVKHKKRAAFKSVGQAVSMSLVRHKSLASMRRKTWLGNAATTW